MQYYTVSQTPHIKTVISIYMLNKQMLVMSQPVA